MTKKEGDNFKQHKFIKALIPYGTETLDLELCYYCGAHKADVKGKHKECPLGPLGQRPLWE